MFRYMKWLVVPAVLVGAWMFVAPQSASAQGFGISIYSGGGYYGSPYGGGYGSYYRGGYGGYGGYGSPYGSYYRGGYGSPYGSFYRGYGHHHHHHHCR